MNLTVTAEERVVLLRLIRREHRKPTEIETPDQFFAAEARDYEVEQVLERKLENLEPGEDDALAQALEREIEDLERSALPGSVSGNNDWMPTSAELDSLMEMED
jgi:uncharacterized membrane protein YccC